jgi:hypothetical protein
MEQVRFDHVSPAQIELDAKANQVRASRCHFRTQGVALEIEGAAL